MYTQEISVSCHESLILFFSSFSLESFWINITLSKKISTLSNLSFERKSTRPSSVDFKTERIETLPGNRHTFWRIPTRRKEGKLTEERFLWRYSRDFVDPFFLNDFCRNIAMRGLCNADRSHRLQLRRIHRAEFEQRSDERKHEKGFDHASTYRRRKSSLSIKPPYKDPNLSVLL